MCSSDLLILADGMGGHVGGVEASRIAVAEFGDAFRAASGDVASRLKAALIAANQAIGRGVIADPTLKGMGCTLIGAVMDQGRVSWVSVGDSLLFAIEAGQVRRLNALHSLAEKIDREAEQGLRSRESAAADPQRHMLLSAMMGEQIKMIDEGHAMLKAGAMLLLASDGIETLTSKEITQACQDDMDPMALVTRLLKEIEDRQIQNQDNTTIIAAVASAALASHKRSTMDQRRITLLIVAIMALLLAVSALTWLIASPPNDNSDRAATPSALPIKEVAPPPTPTPTPKSTPTSIPRAAPAEGPPQIDDVKAIHESNQEMTGKKRFGETPKPAKEAIPTKPAPLAKPATRAKPAVRPERSGVYDDAIPETIDRKHYSPFQDGSPPIV